VIENLEKNLIGIVIGIRFRANFAIEDQLGRIIDDILYKKESLFNPKIFPTVKSTVGGKLLINENTRDMLEIDNSNVIFEATLDDSSTFKLSQIDDIHKNFESQIIQGTMKQFSFKEIVRIGYVRRYLFKLEDLAKIFVNKTVGQSFGGVNDINLRFSKKLPVPEAIIKRDVNDYVNVIFNIIKKSDLQEIFMSIDYQHFYDPFLTTASSIEFKNFLNQMDIFNKDRYLTWLNSYYKEIK
jgi:hypothetical protein